MYLHYLSMIFITKKPTQLTIISGNYYYTYNSLQDKKIVVCLGAVNSPQILLNSGIGPREELNAVGVPVVRDLPGVGKNLHNHVAYAMTFTINDTDTTPLNWATAMEYLLFRDGLMSGTGEADC